MSKRLVATVGAVAAIMVGAGGCSSQPTTYTPAAAAFGNAGLGQCYMPLSVPASGWGSIQQAYVRQGWCQPGWSPTYIPQSTYMAYYPYYSSAPFYTRYVPVSYRTSYVSYETGFGRTYHSQILTAEKTATYRGSNGKTTTYNKISTGGGTRAKFGSGTRCSPVRDALLQPRYQGKGGFGGGSRGGSFGGGSRSGSGGSKSGTGTSGGSKSGGC